MRLHHRLRRVLLALVTIAVPAAATAQRSLAPASPRGQTVTPVFEGWYKNADGSFSLSFGYYSRNSEEVLEVPIGAEHMVSPGGKHQ